MCRERDDVMRRSVNLQEVERKSCKLREGGLVRERFYRGRQIKGGSLGVHESMQETGELIRLDRFGEIVIHSCC